MKKVEDHVRPNVTTSQPQIAKPFDARSEATRIAPPSQLYFATEADGSTWVRGSTYKASFGPAGATYIPFLGSRAPRNFPVELSLGAATVGGTPITLEPATSAVREGDRIVIDRGPIDEVYELALDHVEQTFVVSERPASGALKLRVNLESELERCETADGLELSNEHGAVRYGRAFVREANGTKVPVASRLVQGGVEIEVSESYLAQAAFPLVVDPIISTYSVDNSVLDQFDGDTSYDMTTDRFLIAYEEVFSLADHDVFAQLRDSNGVLTATSYVDFTSESWNGPQTANNNAFDQYICVATASNVVGSPGFVIRARLINAASFFMTDRFNISSTDQSGDKLLPDVGGDAFPFQSGSNYCVVWQRNFSPTDTDIHSRLVAPDGTLLGTGTVVIDNSSNTLDSWPSVSKSNGDGANAAWTIAWHRDEGGGDLDIHAARIKWDGTPLNGSTPIATSLLTDYYPRVSSPLADGTTLIVFARLFSTEHDLEWAHLSGTTVLSSGNLSFLENPETLGQNQVEYSVDSDGARFAVAYAESFATSTFDYDIWVSAFVPFGGTLKCVEAHQSLDFSTLQSFHTDIVAKRSGGAASRSFGVIWDSTGGTSHNMLGGFYDRPAGGGYTSFCYGDGSSGTCPCGNNGSPGAGCANSFHSSGAALFAFGSASTLDDTLQLVVNNVPPNVTNTLFQGTAVPPSVGVFGDGLRCVGGSQIRIRTKTSDGAGVATWPSGNEADISVTGAIPFAGAERFYQVSYRNSASFCTSATFNISNGVRVVWLP